MRQHLPSLMLKYYIWSTSMNIYTPYTYFIKWSKTGMKYYGVRFAQNCHPSEFWIDYFTSSKYVANYVREHGEPDIKIIRKIFSDSEKARLWEHRVLKRLKVTSRNDYLNKSNGKSIPPMIGDANPMKDPLVKEKHYNATHTQEFIERVSGANNPMKIEKNRLGQSVRMKQKWDDKPQQMYDQLNRCMELAQTQQAKEKRRTTMNSPEYRTHRSQLAVGENNPRYDHTVYQFSHISGESVTGTRSYMQKEYGLKPSGLSMLLSGKRTNPYKGWSVLL